MDISYSTTTHRDEKVGATIITLTGDNTGESISFPADAGAYVSAAIMKAVNQDRLRGLDVSGVAQMVADISPALAQESFNRVAEAGKSITRAQEKKTTSSILALCAKTCAAGVATMEDLNFMAHLGYPVTPVLIGLVGNTDAEVRAAVANGGLDASTFIAAVRYAFDREA